ncbi:MAG: tRNA (adenosine(37)-N6)-threonylcarbamoyltransferase complex ATPase subunit type 1 TsaE [Halothermotrichaceae bacterium]
MESRRIFISKSEEDTLDFAEKMGKLIDTSIIILLSGELGAGKTLFARGLCSGLGIAEDVSSPTYTLINEYEGGDLPVFHMDLYRIDTEEELYNLGFEEYIDRNGLIIIEWPDLAYDMLPHDFIYVKILKKADKQRKIILQAEGETGMKLLERLDQDVSIGS